MEQEIWREVKGYEGLYIVSNLGNIESVNIRGNKRLKPTMYGEHPYIGLSNMDRVRSTVQVAKVVAAAFHDWYTPLTSIDHIDGNRLNNRADNIRKAGSGHPLVTYDTTTKSWKVKLYTNHRGYVEISTGYKTPEDAIAALNKEIESRNLLEFNKPYMP